MAETMTLIDNPIIVTQKPFNRENLGPESTESVTPADKSPFRRIEFLPARKPFTGFTKGGGDGSFRLETLNPTTTSSKNNQQSVGSEIGSSGKKRDASEMENGLDPELSFAITIRRIGAGLENLGNTCFLNSVLQCLTYTEPLAAYLQSGKHQVSCRKAGFCALCAIQKHVSRALELSGRSLAPKDLVSNLRCISRTFRNSRQEDAHEYMVNLLESMHKCCLPNGVPSESQSAYDRSLVHKIFGGRLRSQVKCMQCNYCSNKFDPFLDLSLEILKADTLYKAFANFTAKEQLDGGAKQYQCQQCKQKVKALKQLTIHKAPNVLTVHLKRFGSHMSGQKIDKKIQFGSTLDLKPFVTGPYDGDLKYTLYGVLVHAGWSTHSGHYYCFVRTSSGMWYSLDDNRVYQVSEKKVFEQKAYMLFYFKDRKNFPSKKPTTDVHQKDKIVMNGTVNRPGAPKEAQMKTGGSNGLLNGHQSLATVGSGRNGFSPVAPKETQTKTGLSNGLSNGHNSAVTVDTERSGSGSVAPKEAQTKTYLSNGSLNGHKTSVTVGTERNGSGSVALNGTQMNPNLCNGSSNGHKPLTAVGTEKNGPGSVAPNETQANTKISNGSLIGHKPLATVGTERNGFSNGATEQTQTKPNLSNGSLNGHKSSVTVGTVTNGFSNGAPEQTQKKENSVPESISEPSSESKIDTASKIEDHTKENGGQIKEVATALPGLSSLPKVGPTSIEKKASSKKTHKKANNFLKCKNVISMKFSSKVLMGASLTQRKKKKHKRNRRAKNLAQENSVNEGPSSSVKIEPLELVKPAVENGFKENSVNESQSSDKSKKHETVKSPVENGFKERVNKDGAVLATSDSNGVSKISQSNQKDLVHMLTRGLEDRAVPRWDEDESTPSQRRETTRDLTIGYIGDDWDEDYDRGKRKKVRMSQTEFDGQNPFQNIANERLKSHAEKQNLSKRPPMTMKNKQKFKKSRSGNGPFRI